VQLPGEQKKTHNSRKARVELILNNWCQKLLHWTKNVHFKIA